VSGCADTTRGPQAADGHQQWPTVDSVHVGYLSLVQAARYLGAVSTATVRRWIKGHGLPHYHITGCGGERGKLLFRQGELDRWMRRFRNGLAASKNEDGARREAVGDEFRAENIDRTE